MGSEIAHPGPVDTSCLFKGMHAHTVYRKNICGGKFSHFEWKIAICGKTFVVAVL